MKEEPTKRTLLGAWIYTVLAVFSLVLVFMGEVGVVPLSFMTGLCLLRIITDTWSEYYDWKIWKNK